MTGDIRHVQGTVGQERGCGCGSRAVNFAPENGRKEKILSPTKKSCWSPSPFQQHRWDVNPTFFSRLWFDLLLRSQHLWSCQASERSLCTRAHEGSHPALVWHHFSVVKKARLFQIKPTQLPNYGRKLHRVLARRWRGGSASPQRSLLGSQAADMLGMFSWRGFFPSQSCGCPSHAHTACARQTACDGQDPHRVICSSHGMGRWAKGAVLCPVEHYRDSEQEISVGKLTDHRWLT